MAIMVAGGLTFAIPGMEPAYAAQINSNPNLLVSAEGQNADNEITHINIIQVIVRDGDINERNNSEPIVEVDDNTVPLKMRFFSGAWYGYFASTEIQNSGLLPPTDALGVALNDAGKRLAVDALVQGEPNNLSPPPIDNVDDNNTDDPEIGNLVTLYTLDGEFDIVYKKPGDDQTVSLELDNPDVSVSLDRASYPQNTGVAITIDDMAMNVDPTSEDSWFLVVGSDEPRYGNNDASDNVAKLADEAVIREAKITRAAAELEDALDSAETDRQNLVDRADDARQALVDAARVVRDDAIAAAQAIIDNPFTPEADKTAPGEVIGDKTDDDTTLAAYKGTAQVTYEATAGNPDADDRPQPAVTATDTEAVLAGPIFKGTARVLYEGVDGNPQADDAETNGPIFKGTARVTYEETIGTLAPGADKPVVITAFDAYEDTVGTAYVDYVRVAGHGDRSATEQLADDADLITNYAGSAWIAYRTAVAVDSTTDITNLVTAPQMIITGYLETLSIDNTANALECATNGCTTNDGKMWVKFTEDSRNDSKFTNTSDDNPNLKTVFGAARGLDFSVEYDNLVTGGIGFSTTTIVIDAGTEWNSGQEIGITLTDSDTNTNSLVTETLSVTDTDRVIPTIKIGTPFTLAEANSVELFDESTDRTTTITAEATEVSDILKLAGDGNGYVDNDQLIIDIGTRNDVNAYLPPNHVDYVGIHMINYDVSTLDNVESISLQIEGEDSLALVAGGGQGKSIITDNTFDPVNNTAHKVIGDILYDGDNLKTGTEAASLVITFDGPGTINDNTAIIIDLFSFGLADQTDLTSNVNNAIYRLELEEDGDNSSDFVGTLEYIALSQINIVDRATYNGIDAFGDSIILISDDSSISVEYRDLDATGEFTTFTAEADTPTHSGSVSLDSDAYKVADTVTVTVEDADLNADSNKPDVYAAFSDVISGPNAVEQLLSVEIDGEDWVEGCGLTGLQATDFTLQETGRDSGVFVGTFAVPAEHCPSGLSDGEVASVTGSDISVKYVDFRDDSGSLITVSASVGIRSLTGSVSLDRTVYPVPFSATSFEINDGFLGEGELTVYVSIEDADFDTSANGIDSISADTLTIEVIRGSDPHPIPITDTEISETAPNSGVFEYEATLSYGMGPVSDNKCMERDSNCILQGDILHVTYSDPSDASGSSNTVTDSATFDLRNGVLQSDQTAYIIGSDMIVTLIEPDLNLDSGATEVYSLDLIEWDSDAGTAPLSDDVFDAVPSNLLETGDDTGIFQVVVGIPRDIGDDRLERGEEITLTYVDHGPSGSDYVGDKDEEVTTTVYTSNFGATIDLDQRVYTWTDKVYITVVAPDHNIDSDQVDEIGNNDDYPIRVSTRGDELEEYKLVETGADTGIFTGEVILIGFDHDADGDGNRRQQRNYGRKRTY